MPVWAERPIKGRKWGSFIPYWSTDHSSKVHRPKAVGWKV
jgi:hypothetical protein